jgi:hypothetical protein
MYSILTALHEIALMYFSLTVMFEFVYFDPTKPIRWVSIFICMIVVIYYLLYHVYRYYDLMEFPIVDPTSARYDELVIRYGSILKNIRFK